MNKWRIPTIKELVDLVDFNLTDPASTHTGIDPVIHWSSTVDSSYTNIYRTIDFFDGYMLRNSKNQKHYFCPVKTIEDGTLIWGNTSDEKMSYKEAEQYVEELNKPKFILLSKWLIEQGIYYQYCVNFSKDEYKESKRLPIIKNSFYWENTSEGSEFWEAYAKEEPKSLLFDLDFLLADDPYSAISDLSDCKVGDRLFSVCHGWGEVSEITDSDSCPLVFDREEHFTFTGKLSRFDPYPALFKHIPPYLPYTKESTIKKPN